MKRLIVIAMLVVGSAFANKVQADQFQYNDLRVALAAMQVLDKTGSVKLFCAPCGDSVARTVEVQSTSLDLVWDDLGTSNQPYRDNGVGYWEVFVNDDAIDLAYVYVQQDGKWRNLAMMVGQKPVKVPATIQ